MTGPLAQYDTNADAKDVRGRTPLSWAAANGNLALVQTLLATGKVNPDATQMGEDGTPLTWAAEYGHLAVVQTMLATDKVATD